MADIINIDSSHRRLQKASTPEGARHDASFSPPPAIVERLQFRLKRHLGLDVTQLKSRVQWEAAIDALFRLEMAGFAARPDTPPEVREICEELSQLE